MDTPNRYWNAAVGFGDVYCPHCIAQRGARSAVRMTSSLPSVLWAKLNGLRCTWRTTTVQNERVRWLVFYAGRSADLRAMAKITAAWNGLAKKEIIGMLQWEPLGH